MLTDIRLQNFRSYRDASFELSPGVNIIVGPNASGKTNLLEAVLVVSGGRSYRSADDNLIRHGADWGRIDAHTPKGMRSAIFKRQELSSKINKQFLIDDKPYKRLPLAKNQPVVLFEPNHLSLINGEPALRREFLDNFLEKLVPGFDDTRAKYTRALRQRNALLKRPSRGDSQLFAWNLRLSELGGQIALARQELIGRVSKLLTSTYSELASQKHKLTAQYKSPIRLDNYASHLLQKLEESLEQDVLRGFTAHGPHRDDLTIWLNKTPMSLSASRGEVRTLLLALKIIELKLLESDHGHSPLLLLDDVFSELDGKRRRAVAEYLNRYQTFITTTDADIVAKHFVQKFNLIPTTA